MNKVIQNMLKTMIHNYEGTMQSRHLSVAMRNNIPLTDYKHNHNYSKVLGTERGSTHAEMNVIQSLLKGLKGLHEFKVRCIL